MARSFRFVPLPADRFAPLFSQDDARLRSARARLVVVDEKPGYPCRVSLSDAEAGETVVLLSFAHHDVDSPYRASGPIFVRRGVAAAAPGVNTVPVMFRHRLVSVRAYDHAAMLVGAEVVQGAELEGAIDRLFESEGVSYLHVHNAGLGCYLSAVARA